MTMPWQNRVRGIAVGLHLLTWWSAIALLLIMLVLPTFRSVDTGTQTVGRDAERQTAALIATNPLWFRGLIVLAITGTVALGVGWSWFLIRNARAFTHWLEQEEMRRKADMLTCAIEQTLDAVIIADRRGVIEYVNPAFTNLTGYTAEEAIGRTPGALLKSGRQDQAFYQMIWDTILAGNTWHGTLTNRKKSGECYIVDESISPIRNSAGVITHFVAVQHDLTEQRKYERRLQQAEKLEALGQLTGGLAHDFNNLLTPILGYTELLSHSVPPDKRTSRYILDIQHAARQAATLTRQLLTFSRCEDTVLQPIDINGILADMTSLLNRTIGRHIEVRLVPGRSVGMINGNAAYLETAILNLVLNARDAMPDGGELTLKTDMATIGQDGIKAPPGISPGSYVRLSVSDTGHGMPKETAAKIFEPFFTTKEHKGTGLGLAMVDRLVKSMKGFITVTSEPGKGTTFDLYFPQVDHMAGSGTADEPTTETTSTPCAGDETLLIVEDDRQIRNLASSVLRELGYHVLEAENGEAALRMADGYDATIDLLITDIMLPKMNGRQLSLALRQRRPNIKVLYVSGLIDSALLSSVGHLDASAYLPKPYTPGGLAHQVRALLDQP
jgi:two-component system NtrC family sensor kinase